MLTVTKYIKVGDRLTKIVVDSNRGWLSLNYYAEDETYNGGTKYRIDHILMIEKEVVQRGNEGKMIFVKLTLTNGQKVSLPVQFDETDLYAIDNLL
jgi:hypothetical protein